jgi:hypothetical protein
MLLFNRICCWKRTGDLNSNDPDRPSETEMKKNRSMMLYEGMGFVVLLRQFAKIAVDVIRIIALGFELNGHVFDAEAHGDPDLDQLQQLKLYVCVLCR